ncbi:MAG: YggT family protein [Vampirovibrionales bacterium]|jgi:YggT family protein
MLSLFASFLASLVSLYKIVLFVRILLTWIPSLDWRSPILRFLDDITEPVLRVARNLIPPVGMFDLSPIVVFLALNVVEYLLRSL